jgi:hypothetical protein
MHTPPAVAAPVVNFSIKINCSVSTTVSSNVFAKGSSKVRSKKSATKPVSGLCSEVEREVAERASQSFFGKIKINKKLSEKEQSARHAIQLLRY